MSQQYQIGGWYNGQQWDGSKLGPKGQVIVGQNNNSAQQSSNPSQISTQEYQSSVNKYIDNLLSESQGQRDLMLKRLDAEHKLALGNEDPAGAKFLETVADGLEQKIGRIPYDYQRYNHRELEQYALGNRGIAEQKNLALDKLNNDEQIAKQGLGFKQGQANASTAESLNQRGLITGQTPQGMNQPSSLTGLSGLAGKTAGIQNQDFSNQFGALSSTNALARRGINEGAGLAQSTLDFNHNNTMQDLTTGARRDAQDQNNTFSFGQDTANQSYAAAMKRLESERATRLQQATQRPL
jgi:hypothetical protein